MRHLSPRRHQASGSGRGGATCGTLTWGQPAVKMCTWTMARLPLLPDVTPGARGHGAVCRHHSHLQKPWQHGAPSWLVTWACSRAAALAILAWHEVKSRGVVQGGAEGRASPHSEQCLFRLTWCCVCSHTALGPQSSSMACGIWSFWSRCAMCSALRMRTWCCIGGRSLGRSSLPTTRSARAPSPWASHFPVSGTAVLQRYSGRCCLCLHCMQGWQLLRRSPLRQLQAAQVLGEIRKERRRGGPGASACDECS
mmetsp:Transcript_24209/g.66286  ORF Transcript_24209/g.66286 Transcript_24209/m.66286 type:complete len:253 (-) Transcript_24209:301-1059(-)